MNHLICCHSAEMCPAMCDSPICESAANPQRTMRAESAHSSLGFRWVRSNLFGGDGCRRQRMFDNCPTCRPQPYPGVSADPALSALFPKTCAATAIWQSSLMPTTRLSSSSRTSNLWAQI